MGSRCKYLSAVLVLLASTAQGFQQDSVSFKIHNHYVSPRALGMGNAFVAVADDYSGLFYNPAGLARRENHEINMSIEGGVTASFFSFAKDIEEAQNLPNATENQKQQAIMEVIEDQYGSTFGFRLAPATGIWVAPNWGVGVIPLDLSVELTPRQKVGPAIDATVIADTTVALGYGREVNWIPNSRTSVGILGKFVNRGFASKSILAIEAATDPNLISKDDLYEGFTVDADIGILYTPELPGDGWFWKMMKLARPTFGAVIRNVGEFGFGQSMGLLGDNSVGEPERIYRVIDIGTRWEYPDFWIFGGRGVMDFKNILHPKHDFRKGLHLGFEFDWTMFSWWKGQYRVGLNQGYLTLGASALLGVFNLDLVTYGEEVGAGDQLQENRVYMFRANLNF
ncbi:MAG: hypothetical protein ACLGGX_04520 [Bdellovibrionia bacterium]